MTSVFVIDPTQCFCMFCMPKHKPLLHAEGLSKSCSFLLFNFGRSKTFCEPLFSVSACFLFWSNGNNCLSPGQTDLQVRASQCNFAKPEFAHTVAMGGQADSQVAKSIIFQTYSVHLCQLVLTGQTVKNLHRLVHNLSSTHRSSSQVGGQTKHKLNVNWKLVLTCKSVWLGIYPKFIDKYTTFWKERFIANPLIKADCNLNSSKAQELYNLCNMKSVECMCWTTVDSL